MKRVALSWKPQRHGDIYCSPACGGGCTWAEYQEAVKDAEQTAKRLSKVRTELPPGPWKPRVFENLGWHNSISRGVITVIKYRDRNHLNRRPYYHASVQTGGPWMTGDGLNAATPEQAVRTLIAWMRSQLKPCVELAHKLDGSR